MLVLSRKTDERVIIGDKIIVQVVRVDGSRVRLGFSAPPDVPIRREEIAHDNKDLEAAWVEAVP